MRTCRSSAQQQGDEGSDDEASVEDELAKLEELQNKSGKKGGKPKSKADAKEGVKPKRKPKASTGKAK